MNADRFKAIKGSQTAHCCFEATVIDTTKPHMDFEGKPMDWFTEVCECFDMASAETIAAALNLVEEDR